MGATKKQHRVVQIKEEQGDHHKLLSLVLEDGSEVVGLTEIAITHDPILAPTWSAKGHFLEPGIELWITRKDG